MFSRPPQPTDPQPLACLVERKPNRAGAGSASRFAACRFLPQGRKPSRGASRGRGRAYMWHNVIGECADTCLARSKAWQTCGVFRGGRTDMAHSPCSHSWRDGELTGTSQEPHVCHHAVAQTCGRLAQPGDHAPRRGECACGRHTALAFNGRTAQKFANARLIAGFGQVG